MNIRKFCKIALINIFLFQANSVAQSLNKPLFKEYSFGKAYYMGGIKLPNYTDKYRDLINQYKSYGLYNRFGTYYSENSLYSSESISKLFFSDEIKHLYLLENKIKKMKAEI